jgi:hypothetical protein
VVKQAVQGDLDRRGWLNEEWVPYNDGMTQEPPGELLLDRMVRAVEKVKERLRRATAALEKAGVPYAVVDGNAVAA